MSPAGVHEQDNVQTWAAWAAFCSADITHVVDVACKQRVPVGICCCQAPTCGLVAAPAAAAACACYTCTCQAEVFAPPSNAARQCAMTTLSPERD